MQSENRQLYSKLSLFSTVIVLLLPLVWTFEASAVGPALGTIAHAFPKSSDLQIKMIMTMPFISSSVFSFVSGWLARYIDKKIILIVGLLIYGITGISPAFATNITQIFVLRFITGIGVGLVLPIPNVLITEYFAGESRRRMLGLTTSVANLANILASLVSGSLLVFGWQYPFYTFGIVFVILVLAVIGIPSSPPVAQHVNHEVILKEKMTWNIFGLFLFMALNWIFLATIVTSIAIFMIKEKVGMPWMIGFAISMPACACLIFGGLYPEIRRIFRGYFVTITFLFFAAGFFVVSQAYSVYEVSLGAFLIGIGNGLLTPHILALTATYVKPAQRAAAFGLVTAGIGAGEFLSPFLQGIVVMISGDHSYRFLYLVMTACLICLGVISLFFKSGIEKQKNEETSFS